MLEVGWLIKSLTLPPVNSESVLLPLLSAFSISMSPIEANGDVDDMDAPVTLRESDTGGLCPLLYVPAGLGRLLAPSLSDAILVKEGPSAGEVVEA